MLGRKSSCKTILRLYGAWDFAVRMILILLTCLLIVDGMASYGREPLIKYSEWYDSAKNLMIDNLSDRKPIVRADMLRFALPNNETLEMMNNRLYFYCGKINKLTISIKTSKHPINEI